jgi:peptide deformylase
MHLVSPPLKIVNYPHPSLRHPAVALTGIDAKVERIAASMIALMKEHNGLGLAAPQVGLPFRLFVANIPLDPEKPDEPGVFLNPVFREEDGSRIEAEEGCLSFPGLYAKVRRFKSVIAQAYDLRGRLLEIRLSNLLARVWQHETDHLDGKLFIDYLNFVGRLSTRSAVADFESAYRRAQRRGEIPPNEQIERQLSDLAQAGPPEVPPPQEPPCVL